MNRSPRFSVVIPLYNKAAYVAETLQTVLEQSEQDFEIVIVDDGSTDGSIEVVKGIADPRIRLLQPGRGGVSRARNHGFTQARGEWVALLDSDDRWHRDHLATLARGIAAFPGVGMVSCAYRTLDAADRRWQDLAECRRPLAENPMVRVKDVALRLLAGGNFLCSSSVAIHRDVLAQVVPCFPEGETNGEDIDTWLRLNAVTDCIEIPIATADYRHAAINSLSQQSRSRTFEEAPFLMRAEAAARTGSAPAWQRASLLRYVAEMRVTLARDALGGGDRRQAKALLARARGHAAPRRWWVTQLMATALPGRWAASWQQWRIRRSQEAHTASIDQLRSATPSQPQPQSQPTGFRGDLQAAQEGLLSLGFWALQVYRFGRLRYRFRSKLIRIPLGIVHLVLAKLAESFCGVVIGVGARIGQRLTIEHSGAIVVHGNAEIGDDCILRQGVTIGIRRLDAPTEAPRIGDRVNIGAGAKILGAVTIGDDVDIGANAVVLKDLPAGAIAVGVPARVIRIKGQPERQAVRRAEVDLVEETVS